QSADGSDPAGRIRPVDERSGAPQRLPEPRGRMGDHRYPRVHCLHADHAVRLVRRRDQKNPSSGPDIPLHVVGVWLPGDVRELNPFLSVLQVTTLDQEEPGPRHGLSDGLERFHSLVWDCVHQRHHVSTDCPVVLSVNRRVDNHRRHAVPEAYEVPPNPLRVIDDKIRVGVQEPPVVREVAVNDEDGRLTGGPSQLEGARGLLVMADHDVVTAQVVQVPSSVQDADPVHVDRVAFDVGYNQADLVTSAGQGGEHFVEHDFRTAPVVGESVVGYGYYSHDSLRISSFILVASFRADRYKRSRAMFRLYPSEDWSISEGCQNPNMCPGCRTVGPRRASHANLYATASPPHPWNPSSWPPVERQAPRSITRHPPTAVVTVNSGLPARCPAPWSRILRVCSSVNDKKNVCGRWSLPSWAASIASSNGRFRTRVSASQTTTIPSSA